ncbi:PQ loop repeat-domain-containing protein [Blastocladiella britannica]|nr:PQ loop repeat-domain-containing protein [Blastocladiella britannica]
MDKAGSEILSISLGWAYFAAWSISFYPQLILNYQRKSVEGLSLDFIAYNFLGFTCYGCYTLAFYFWPAVQDEFKRRNDGRENLVAPNDVFFAVHAWLLTLATGIQVLQYRKRRHRLSPFARTVLLGFAASLAVMLGWTIQEPKSGLLDLVYFLGTWKLLMSLIKYLPQLWINARDKSTEGWSIHNIVLDSTGGTLSLMQLLLDAWRSSGGGGDPDWLWHAVYGNAAKLGLSLLSLGFDVLFMGQHFVLYRNNPRPTLNREVSSQSQQLAGESESLLGSGTTPIVYGSTAHITVTIPSPVLLSVGGVERDPDPDPTPRPPKHGQPPQSARGSLLRRHDDPIGRQERDDEVSNDADDDQDEVVRLDGP